MKKKKSRLIVSLLTAFIMAFTVFPYMGSAGQVSAAEASYEQAWNNPNWGKTKYDFVKTVTFVLKSDNLYDAKVSLDFSKLTSSEFSAIKVSVIRTQWFNTNGGMQTSNFSNAVVGDAKTYEFYSYSGGTRFWFSDLTPGKSIKLRMIVNAFGFDYCPELTISVPVICASGHSWDSGSVTTPATCKVAGVKTYTCTVCGTTKTEPIDKTTNHSWNSGIVTKAATCKAAGVKTYTCTVCSTTKAEPIDKTTTHSYSGGACTVCGVADPSVKVEEAKDKALGTYTVKKGDYTTKEYLVGQLYLDQSVNTLNFYNYKGTLVLRDSNGNQVVSGKSMFDNDDIDQYITKAGMYKLYAKTASTSGFQDYSYTVTYTLTKDINYTYKYASLTATATESGMDNVPAVKIEYGNFDGPTGSVKDLAIFRESNGKIRKLDISYYSGQVDTIKIDYGTNYTYYIVDLGYVTGTAKTTLSNIGTVDETLKDAIKTALTDSHVTKSNTVKTKDIPMAKMWYVRVDKQGVKSAEISWDATGGYVSNYTVDIINSKGETVKTYAYDGTSYPKLDIYVPYEGTSTIKVTPYYNGVAGEPMTQTVESAKIAAAGGHVTKISSTNARIVATRYPGADGLQVQQKVGKKWKNVTSSKGTTAKEYKKTWKKNKAGKTSYRFRSYVKDAGKTYYSGWKTYKPKSNVGTYTKWSVSYVRSLHGWADVYFYPTKIQYKGSKIKVTGRFINTWHYAPDKGKFKVTFKVDGKSIGSKTITCKSIKANSAKTTTFYLSGAKKGKDLRSAGYSVKTYY